MATNHFDFDNIEVEGRDCLRDVPEIKYGVRHVPVPEYGRGHRYEALTDFDLERLKSALFLERETGSFFGH